MIVLKVITVELVLPQPLLQAALPTLVYDLQAITALQEQGILFNAHQEHSTQTRDRHQVQHVDNVLKVIIAHNQVFLPLRMLVLLATTVLLELM